MKYNELKNQIEEIKTKTIKICQQTNIMFIPLTNKIVKENGTEEVKVQYGIDHVINEFLYKENKTLFLIEQLLKCYMQILKNQSEMFCKNNISFPPSKDYCELTYYFDSFVASFSTIIENDQKEILEKFFDKEQINNVFPTRNKIGLYWQINMLRNRILHFTGRRYEYTNKYCCCYENFSSEIKMIRVDKNGNISIPSTLIDIYSDKNIENAINKSIKDGTTNTFDNLFPNKTPKGYSKKKPFVYHISNNIFFDYTHSLVKLLNEIEDFFDKINNVFIKELSLCYDDIDELNQSKTIFIFEGKELTYSVEDVFNI